MSIDLTLARNKMVDGQIRPARVNDSRLLDAMRTLPRERFVPAGLEASAYIDSPIELGDGRQMMEPRVLARLIQLAMPRRGERALVVGANTGYGAALLARLGLVVVALEEDDRLIATARSALADANVALISGKLAHGVTGEAPFHIVLVEGAVEQVPAPIEGSVSPDDGRLVTVLLRGAAGQGVLAERSGQGLAMRPHFDAAARLLPGFALPTGFRF